MPHMIGDDDRLEVTAPSVRLAHVPGAQGDNNLLGQRGVQRLEGLQKPALLVSFFYLLAFLKQKDRYAYRNWALDSGAFSARNIGADIDLAEYTSAAKRLVAADPTLVEVFALDVIGDWKATIKNTEWMWKKGVEAIPTYHYADKKWDVLVGLAKDYPKVAIGGMADLKGATKRWYVEQCFARVWPKKIHGFGCVSEAMVLGFPFHSVDATNWEIGPCKFGMWRAFGHQRVSVRGSAQNLRAEVEWYLELERKARERWHKEMARLDGMDAGSGSGPASGSSPTVRLAHKQSGREKGKGLEPGKP